MTEKIKKFNVGFTQVSNVVITDPKLSLKAKAIYAYLFSKPDGWVFHIDVMRSEIKESKKVIRSSIKELINCGYIKRNQVNEKGRFGGIEYEFIEIDRVTKNRHTVNPHTQNCHTNNTYSITNKDKSNISPKSPKRDSVGIVSLVAYFKKCSKEEVSSRDYDKVQRWLDRNNLDIKDVIDITQFWIDNRDDSEYAPQVNSLGEFFIKFDRLTRFYENNC